MPLSESKVRSFVKMLAADPKQVESLSADMIRCNPVIADVAHLCRRINALSERNRRLAVELATERAKRVPG